MYKGRACIILGQSYVRIRVYDVDEAPRYIQLKKTFFLQS